LLNRNIEKYAIFSKGFRGLPDGWHNLRPMNFLIGENSTGKSSFLQLIEIIDSPNYHVFLDLCGVVPGIDTAFDVCSRLGGNKETTVGYLLKRNAKDDKESQDDTTNTVHFGKLSTYKMVSGELQLTKLTIFAGDKLIRLKRSQGRISSKISDMTYFDQENHTLNAKRFEDIHFDNKKKFKKERDVNWSRVRSQAVWVNTLRKVAFRSFEDGGSDFILGMSPLNCLQYGPLRGKTRRLHHGLKNEFSSTGEHFPFLIKEAINESPNLYSVIKKFGHESGLFDEISIASVKTDINDKPFAVQIEKSGSHFYLDELGFGVGQVLPIIADVAMSSSTHAFLIQQPELHLHPKAQASLGDVFLRATQDGGVFVVETHSDFIVDRFRLRHKKEKEAPRAQIIYFEKDEESGLNRAHEMEFDEDGGLNNIPEGYRDFFVKESYEQFENF